MKAPANDPVLKAFDAVWTLLFTTPVHLDSALSKQDVSVKSALAQIIAPILARPVSLAEALGVGVTPGEPWSLSREALATWRPARLLAERLRDRLSAGGVAGTALFDGDYPPAMTRAWESELGRDTARVLARVLGESPPIGLRAARKVGAEALLKELRAGGLPVKAELSAISPVGVRLSSYAAVMGTEAFTRGDFEIQDEGSQALAFFSLWPEKFAPFLAAAPGSQALPPPLVELPVSPGALTIVDACAGAGGKTLALADALEGKGRVFAYDTSEKKLQSLRKRASRDGLRNVQAVAVKDGAEAEVVKKFRRRAQVVLVDAPCSGWGVLRRNPDAKWRSDAAALDRMPPLQGRLLDAYSDLVAPGGRLVFGVCTFRDAETRAVARAFLERHPDFTAHQGGYLGPGITDGFFMQAFERAGKSD